MEITTLSVAEIKVLLQKENLLHFNRNIQPYHVNNMIDSLKTCGLLRLPIIGDISAFDERETAIIDGQHLCKAISIIISDQDEPINVMKKIYETPIELIRDISKLNITQKPWKDEDYLEAWYLYGKDNKYFENYEDLYGLKAFFKELPTTFLINLFSDDKEEFRNGNLTLDKRDVAMKIALTSRMIRLEFNEPVFALHGLRLWVENRERSNKVTDFKKLESRIEHALRNTKVKASVDKNDFAEFIEREYTRV